MNELIEFDLERAKKGDEVITRGGEIAYFYASDYTDEANEYPYIFQIGDSLLHFDKQGKYRKDLISEVDLFMSCHKQKNMYINIYQSLSENKLITGKNLYKTEDEAERFKYCPAGYVFIGVAKQRTF